MGKVQVEAYKCERCSHIWLPRNTKQDPKFVLAEKAHTGIDHDKTRRRDNDE